MSKLRRFHIFLFVVLFLTVMLIAVSAEDEPVTEDTCNEGIFNEQLGCVTGGKLHLCTNNFPDQAFREYLSPYAKNGFLDAANVNTITKVDLSSASPITSLGGIEFLAGLESLQCAGNSLTFLDVSANRQLTYLDCSHNQLTQLDLGELPRLTTLLCNKNRLTALDLSQCNALEFLDCSENLLESLTLDAHPSNALEFLNCSKNLLESLTLDAHPKLKRLVCQSNPFPSLDLRDCTALSYLCCSAVSVTRPYDPGKQNIEVTYQYVLPSTIMLTGNGDQFDISLVIGKENIGNVIRINHLSSSSNAKDPLPYDPATGMLTIPDYRNQYWNYCVGEYAFFDSSRNASYLKTFAFCIACNHEWTGNCLAYPKCIHCNIRDYNSGFGPHIWLDPTVDQPKTCSVCGKKDGHPLEHVWGPATCTSASKCLYCSRFQGTQLPHDWKSATKTEPKTCIQCGREEGHPLEHVWQEATCSFPEKCRYCTETRGNAVGHNWAKGSCVRRAKCTLCGKTDKLGNHRFITPTLCTNPIKCIICNFPIPMSQKPHQMRSPTLFKPARCANCSYQTGSSYLNQFLFPIVAVVSLSALVFSICWIRNYRRIRTYPDIPPRYRPPKMNSKKA